MITHDEKVASHSGRILHMEDGRVRNFYPEPARGR